jgi:hypothetical protein
MIILDKYNLRKITRADFIAIAMKAEKLNYNRRIPVSEAKKADGIYVGIVSPVLLHEHAAGKPVDMHWRCDVLMRFEDSDKAENMLLDIPMDMFEAIDLIPSEVIDRELPEAPQNLLISEDGFIANKGKPIT